ncbi:hypothetical protein ACFV0R_02185 [Streptomyces sp. NPDC059578]|uniref:hypothetical protein n=1 Tax=Streptomyces sp. NPDC059578 TaxID=3346874 RepID=UPI0036768FCA
MDIGDLHAGAVETAVNYLTTPPAPMAERAHVLREATLQRIRETRYRPDELADLYSTVGRLSGVLAYALLDLGSPAEAMRHAEATARCAERAGDLDLAAWAAGTQSLIARFQGDYPLALQHARRGLRWTGSGHGTGEARLRCGEAQCLANLGDAQGAYASLNLAEHAREHVGADAPGLFGFSIAKQSYYTGSSLIWLDGDQDARRAIVSATSAITAWRAAPPEERALKDERLAQVYIATAHALLRDVEGAAETVRPLLSLSGEERISWIGKRMGRLADLLSDPHYRGNHTAAELIVAIRDLSETTG